MYYAYIFIVFFSFPMLTISTFLSCILSITILCCLSLFLSLSCMFYVRHTLWLSRYTQNPFTEMKKMSFGRLLSHTRRCLHMQHEIQMLQCDIKIIIRRRRIAMISDAIADEEERCKRISSSSYSFRTIFVIWYIHLLHNILVFKRFFCICFCSFTLYLFGRLGDKMTKYWYGASWMNAIVSSFSEQIVWFVCMPLLHIPFSIEKVE